MDLCIEARTKEEIAKVAKNRVWFKRETVDCPLTDEQYEIFKKGYAPDWDCRFAPVFMDGWFYFSSSNTRGIRRTDYGISRPTMIRPLAPVSGLC